MLTRLFNSSKLTHCAILGLPFVTRVNTVASAFTVAKRAENTRPPHSCRWGVLLFLGSSFLFSWLDPSFHATLAPTAPRRSWHCTIRSRSLFIAFPTRVQ